MPTAEKERLVAEVGRQVREAAGFYLLSFTGLSVPEMNALREEALKAGARLQVVKNRLLRLALGEELSHALEPQLTGPTMIAYCATDPIGPAQALARFAEEHPGLALKAGYVEGRVLSAEEAARVAALPPKPMILAEALGAVSAPLQGLVGVIGAALAELVYVMEAAIEKQQGAQAA